MQLQHNKQTAVGKKLKELNKKNARTSVMNEQNNNPLA